MTEPKSNVAMISLKQYQESELVARLNEVRADIRRLQLEDCPIKVGDIVQCNTGRQRSGKLYRVADIDPNHQPMPWIWGHPKLKGGGWSKGVHRLFGNFEKVPQP